MSITDLIRRTPDAAPMRAPEAIPQDIAQKLQRGAKARDKNKTRRELCRKFWEGQQYAYLDARGMLQNRTMGGVGVVAADKPGHRIRVAVRYILMIVEAKVSACTQKTPGYEVTPSTNDQDARQAASLSEQVSNWGYDEWKIRRSRVKAVTTALVTAEAFTVPFFDTQLGERDPETGQAEGNIRDLHFDRDQVSWEPDEDFDDSRWHALERSMRPDEVQAMPGYVGEELKMPDGRTPDRVKVTEYLERPCNQWPLGRRMWFADARVMVDYRQDPECPEGYEYWWEPYPYMDAQERVIDEPVPHRLSYTVNPWTDADDMGLVERLIDLATTVDDCLNKIREWKNRTLMPQMVARRGAKLARRTDVPGAVNYYDGQEVPTWEPTPQIPQELFSLYEMARDEMRALAADVDVQAQARLSSNTVDAAVEQGANRWQSFMGDLAEYDSRLMRHRLVLVTRFFTEKRQIEIRGQYGWESVRTFDATDLQSQVSVKVMPESLAQTTRAQRQAMVQFLQANWPGSISAEAAMGYIDGGVAAGLIESPLQQIAKAWRIVKQLMAGAPPESLGARFDPDVPNLAAPPIPGPPSEGPPDPLTGLPTVGPPTFVAPMGTYVPNYMPAPWDNVDIWRKVVGDTMATEKFEQQPETTREAFYEMWRGLDFSEQQRAAKMAAQQEMQAQSIGASNAAKPSLPPPLPDRAGFTPGSNQSSTPTPG